jgi:hypothetical protein
MSLTIPVNIKVKAGTLPKEEQPRNELVTALQEDLTKAIKAVLETKATFKDNFFGGNNQNQLGGLARKSKKSMKKKSLKKKSLRRRR